MEYVLMMYEGIFRQYDIRGKVGIEMPLDQIYALTQAIACYFMQQKPTVKTVAVGADGRTHSPAIKDEVCRALRDSGLHVIYIGMCPTPVLYFSLHTIDTIDAGLMITASHNGKEYNGIKICLDKESIWGQQLQEIKKLYQAGKYHKTEEKGSYQERFVIDEYIEWMYKNFPHLVNMPLSAVVDCGNGATGTVLPALVQKMQWTNVSLLYPEVDGTYPNHEADPIVEKNMQDVKKVLQTTDIQIGIGLDGDGDRMTPMTKQGILVSGDKLLALFARQIIKQHPHAAVIFDIKCSSGLMELLQKWGARPFMVPSGHSIIKDRMKQYHGLLAGELSCHFFFKDRYFGYDDGIYAMLRLFEIIMITGKSLDELLHIFPIRFSTPEIRIDCADQDKEQIVAAVRRTFEHKQVKLITIDGIRVMMKESWGLLRSSNTQPVLCLRFEADSVENLKHIQQEFITALQPYYDRAYLQQHILQI